MAVRHRSRRTRIGETIRAAASEPHSRASATAWTSDQASRRSEKAELALPKVFEVWRARDGRAGRRNGEHVVHHEKRRRPPIASVTVEVDPGSGSNVAEQLKEHPHSLAFGRTVIRDV